MPINLLYLFYHGEIFEKFKLYIKLLYIQESEGKKLLRVERLQIQHSGQNLFVCRGLFWISKDKITFYSPKSAKRIHKWV